ncbi:hypothetical protein HDV03_001471 [Kappamyces sp. JEL0829]|nr:hypothetical protein HDV03_001471 [Kappamyces sp. JEL0829]
MFFGRSLKDTANKSLPSEDSGDEYQEPRPALRTASVSPLPNPKVRDGKSRTAPKGERSEGINHKFIERLIEELDRKNEAINKIGQDCLVLRRNAADQEKIIGKLRESLDESDLKTKRLIQSFDIDIIPHNELKRRYGLLAQKLETTLEKLDNSFKRIDQLERIEFEKEKAHTAQQALVLDLQESVQKAQKFKSVIQKQETVIDKLEAELALQKQQNELVLPSGLAAANSVSSGLAPTASVSSIPRPSIVSSSAVLTPTSSYVSSLRSSVVSVQKEASLEAAVESPAAVDSELSQRLLRLHEENNVLRERLQQSEMNAAAASAAAASAEAKLASASKKEEVTVKHHVGSDQPVSFGAVEMFKLLMRAEAAEIKTKALEQELIESAKVFGRQIRELKQRLK